MWSIIATAVFRNVEEDYGRFTAEYVDEIMSFVPHALGSAV